ncbi:MAG: FeoB-associated Cys-rich membrane protein [Lawsonibacter sp.]|nr:FeoB-associated Cys-rich membrane protein [Lawsonibacter sp.]
MTFGEFIILLALAAAVGLAVRSLWRGRGSCGRCNGDCSRCGGCHKQGGESPAP